MRGVFICLFLLIVLAACIAPERHRSGMATMGGKFDEEMELQIEDLDPKVVALSEERVRVLFTDLTLNGTSSEKFEEEEITSKIGDLQRKLSDVLNSGDIPNVLAADLLRARALDLAAAEIRSTGAERFLVRLGSNYLAGDSPYGKKGWPVRIEGELSQKWIANEALVVRRSSSGIAAVGADEAWIADFAAFIAIQYPAAVERLQSEFPAVRWIFISAAE